MQCSALTFWIIRRALWALPIVALILIVAALESGFFYSGCGSGPLTQTRHDISQLSVATEAFRSHHAVPCLPASFDLHDTYPTPDDPHAAFLRQLFPAIATPPSPAPSWLPSQSLGTGAALPAKLNGSQCLVFFLGGPDGDGFAATPLHPAFRGASYDKRTGPFFDFRAHRISPTGEYLDQWGTPYAYFTAVNGNDYEYWDPADPAAFRAGHPMSGRGPQGPGGARPLWKTPTEAVNVKTFQIISAGPDRVFGRGGVWRPGHGDYAPGQPGYDDLSNFHDGPLGEP